MKPKREWTTFWKIFVAGTYVMYAAFMWYMYDQGKKGNPKYKSFYMLVHKPSWQHFKDWWAEMANDPMTDILMTFAFVIIPVPFLPYYAHNRIEILMAKLGLYFLVTTLILGKPKYDPKKTGESKRVYIAGWLFAVLLVLVATVSYILSRKKYE